MAREQWLVSGPKTIDIETVREVRANLSRGSVSFIADEGSSARVEVTSLRGRDLRVAIEGDALVIEHPPLDRTDPGTSARELLQGPEAVVSVRLPATAPIRVRTVAAEVLVSGARAAVRASSVTGDLLLDSVTGPARLSTTGGEVHVRDHRGSVTARTITGGIVLAGAIDVAEVATALGTTIIDIEGVLPDRIAFRSASGALTLRLPKDATPSYAISQSAGRTELDGERVKVGLGRVWRSARADLSSALTEVHLATIAGRMSVLRGADTRAEARPGLPASAAAAPGASPRDGGSSQSRPATDPLGGAATPPPPPAGDPNAAPGSPAAEAPTPDAAAPGAVDPDHSGADPASDASTEGADR